MTDNGKDALDDNKAYIAGYDCCKYNYIEVKDGSNDR